MSLGNASQNVSDAYESRSRIRRQECGFHTIHRKEYFNMVYVKNEVDKLVDAFKDLRLEEDPKPAKPKPRGRAKSKPQSRSTTKSTTRSTTKSKSKPKPKLVKSNVKSLPLPDGYVHKRDKLGRLLPNQPALNPSGRPKGKRQFLDNHIEKDYGVGGSGLLERLKQIANYDAHEDFKSVAEADRPYWKPLFTSEQILRATIYLTDQYFTKAIQNNHDQISSPDDTEFKISFRKGGKVEEDDNDDEQATG